MFVGTGEVAQWLEALTALPGNLGFNSQYPPGGSQLPTPTPGDLRLSSGLHGYQECTCCTDTHVGKTLIHIK